MQRKWQSKWESAKAFEPSKDPSKKKFFFTVPYPYVSGLLHVGHGRTYTNGDVIARYRRMAGDNVLWPMAFHITGTPVLAISAKISAGDADTLRMFEEYVSIYEQDKERIPQIVRSFSDPQKLVDYFSGKLVSDFASMGYSLDFSRQFTTGDKEYNKLIEWQFHKYKEKGFLRQAAYPILYCVNDRNAVGEDDIKDADTVPVETQAFVSFKYELEGSDAYIVTCTLRPDTAFGILNLYVNPKTAYVKVKASAKDGSWSEKWIVSRPAAERLALHNYSIEILEEVPGESLVTKYCRPLHHREHRVPIFPADFADADVCTGIVHSSARSPVDYLSLLELKKDEKAFAKYPGLKEQVVATVIPDIIVLPGFSATAAKDMAEKYKINNAREHDKIRKAMVELYRLDNEQGIMSGINKQFAGMKVSQAKKEISEFLKQNNWSFDFYQNSRPATCRCGGKVVCAVLSDQWFIDFNSQGWKAQAKECLDSMVIFPDVYRKQFEDVFAWLDKRPCARRRGLGTKLPFNEDWIIESLSDSTIYMSFYTIIKKIRERGIIAKQLVPAFFDYVFLGKSSAAEVSKLSGVAASAIEEIRGEFLYWYPNDLRHTGIAHITNHLSFFIFAHAAIFEKRHWPKGISLNEFIISEGTKMSKSKGNVVLLNSVAGNGDADVFRLYIAGAADFSSVLDYRARDVQVAKKSLNKFISTISSMAELATPNASQTPSQAAQGRSGNAYKWFASKFERAVTESTLALEQFRLRDYVQQSFHSLLKDYDYFSRRATPAEKTAAGVDFVQRWVALLSPAIPHSCEELWERTGGKGFVSLSHWPQAKPEGIDPEVELREDLVGEMIFDARRILQVVSKGGRKFLAATIITASPEKWEALEKAFSAKTAEEAAAQASGAGIAGGDEALKEYLLKNFYALSHRARAKDGKLLRIDEAQVLSVAADFISGEIGLRVKVEPEAASANPKAGKAMPFKPAIVLE